MKERILSIGLINVSVIREVFFITGTETLPHVAPLKQTSTKNHPALHVKQRVVGDLDCR